MKKRVGSDDAGNLTLSWHQTEICLTPQARGFHLVTHEIVAQIGDLERYEIGMLHLFLQHTSAALALNENADPDVGLDLEDFFSRLAPENDPSYRHTLEGPDDLPAHLRAVMIGTDLTIPVRNGQLALGTWQGIYLCEHRNAGGARRIIATLNGRRGDT